MVPFHTSPGASVTMRVADRSFGPVVADRQGRVEIPIQVPPGVRAGVGARRRPQRRGARDRGRPAAGAVPAGAGAGARHAGRRQLRRDRRCSRVEPDGDARQPGAADAGRVRRPGPPARRGPPGEARFLFEAPRRAGQRRGRADRDRGRARPPAAPTWRCALRVGRARAAGDLAQHAPPGGRRAATRRASPISAHDAVRQPDLAPPGSTITVDGRPAPGRDRRRRPGHADRRAARQVRRPRAHHDRRHAGRHPRDARSSTSPAARPRA